MLVPFVLIVLYRSLASGFYDIANNQQAKSLNPNILFLQFCDSKFKLRMLNSNTLNYLIVLKRML